VQTSGPRPSRSRSLIIEPPVRRAKTLHLDHRDVECHCAQANASERGRRPAGVGANVEDALTRYEGDRCEEALHRPALSPPVAALIVGKFEDPGAIPAISEHLPGEALQPIDLRPDLRRRIDHQVRYAVEHGALHPTTLTTKLALSGLTTVVDDRVKLQVLTRDAGGAPQQREKLVSHAPDNAQPGAKLRSCERLARLVFYSPAATGAYFSL
jgi:hypothetical protein